jgi:hypothetical protein
MYTEAIASLVKRTFGPRSSPLGTITGRLATLLQRVKSVAVELPPWVAAHLTRNSVEQGQLLKSVLLNCSTDGVSLWPVYREPFDLIFERAKSEDWSALGDDFRTFLITPHLFQDCTAVRP